MENEALLKNYLEKELAIAQGASFSLEALKEKLAVHISRLINDDFKKLVALLYNIDVDENKLRLLLNGNPAEDAGEMIAQLIIERQIQKIRTRQEFKSGFAGSEEEKW